jgi:hypothetical protein
MSRGCNSRTGKNSCAESSHNPCKHKENVSIDYFTHNIQLQLTDSLGFAFPDAKFWVKLDIIKIGPLVTISFPNINFETLSIAAPPPQPPFNKPGNPAGFIPTPGGFIYTANGFLPECVRPNDLVNRAVNAPSYDGLILPGAAFQRQTATALTGFNLQITNSGEIVIQAAGTFGGIIPPGSHILPPNSITYPVKPIVKLCKNLVISNGATDTTQFTDSSLANNGVRDSHYSDAFNGVAAWAWSDNSALNKTQNTLDAMVSIGTNDSKLRPGAPYNLTNYPLNTIAWDTAVAINRTNPQNIVVSWGKIPGQATGLLTVTSPGGVAGNYPASVGANSPTSPFNVGPALIVPTIPADACSPITNGAQITGNIALIAAAGFNCGSGSKATNAFNHGAIGVIIYSDDETLPRIGGSPLGPTIAVRNSVGIAILNAYNANPGSVVGNISGEIRVTLPQRAVTLDGGNTWVANGPIDILPVSAKGFGDNRGVIADKNGNFWYATTLLISPSGALINAPTFAYSTDGGITFIPYPQANLNLPALGPGQNFDYPQVAFGTDSTGQYGLYYTALLTTFGTDVQPIVGFLPVDNPINPARTGTSTVLTQFLNNVAGSSITASNDGRVWLQGIVDPFFTQSYVNTSSILYKSPGALNANWAGPWIHDTFYNFIPYPGHGYPFGSGYTSQPVIGVFLHSIQSIIFDDARQVFYAVLAFKSPDYSQNMRLVFVVSRDNCQTFSDPIDIATTDSGNRGFQSMALDTVTGNLVFGWYDGRNDPSFKSLEYFSAIITRDQIDCLVNDIPLSNPIYVIASNTPDKVEKIKTLSIEDKEVNLTNNRRHY